MMKTTSKGLCETFIRMIDFHAEMHDADFVGQIIQYSLGISGFCMDFGKCTEEGIYYLEWSTGDGDWYSMTFTKSEIMTALRNHDFEYTIEVTQRR